MGSDLDGPFRFGGPCGKEIALDAFGSFPDFSLAVPHEAEVAHLTALTEGLGALEIDIVEATIVDDITAAEHRAETLKESFGVSAAHMCEDISSNASSALLPWRCRTSSIAMVGRILQKCPKFPLSV